MPSIHGSSTSSEIGSRPDAKARSITLGDSAMNSPLLGSVAQLDFSEIGVGGDTLVVDGIKMDELHFAGFR